MSVSLSGCPQIGQHRQDSLRTRSAVLPVQPGTSVPHCEWRLPSSRLQQSQGVGGQVGMLSSLSTIFVLPLMIHYLLGCLQTFDYFPELLQSWFCSFCSFWSMVLGGTCLWSHLLCYICYCYNHRWPFEEYIWWERWRVPQSYWM